jgi:hypothetical protein
MNRDVPLEGWMDRRIEDVVVYRKSKSWVRVVVEGESDMEVVRYDIELEEPDGMIAEQEEVVVVVEQTEVQALGIVIQNHYQIPKSPADQMPCEVLLENVGIGCCRAVDIHQTSDAVVLCLVHR